MTGKRELQINVRMTAEDLKKLKQAADVVWPGAPLSRSSLILGLAIRAAEDILQSKPRKSR